MAEPIASTSAHGAVPEITPLLVDVESEQTQPREVESNTSISRTPSAADRTTPVVVATWLSLATGLGSIIFATAFAILRSIAPRGFSVPYMIEDLMKTTIVISGIAVVAAINNLIQLRRVNRTMPVLLNLLVDALIALPLMGSLSGSWDSVGYSCYSRYGPNPELPKDDLRRCEAWGRIVMPIIWLFMVLASVTAFAALFLFVARFVLLFQHRRPGSPNLGEWRFPAGQFTVALTFKFLRQEVRQDAAAAVDRQEQTGA